jgi:hypothetical protein
MLEDMRKYVRAGIEVLSSQGTDERAGAFLSRAQAFAEQLSSLAAGFREWSAEARASLLAEVKQIVASQVKDMGLATKEDLEALRARVDRLEAGSRTSSGGGGRGSRSGAGSSRGVRSSGSPRAPQAEGTGKGRRRSAKA